MSFRFFAPDLCLKINRRVMSIRDSDGKTHTYSFKEGDGFSHPRVFPGNFNLAGVTIHREIRNYWHALGFFALLKPRIVLNVAEQFAGGLSDIERRMLRDLFEPEARELFIVNSETEEPSDIGKWIDQLKRGKANL